MAKKTKDIQGRIYELAKRRDKDGFELASLLCAVRQEALWSYWADNEGVEFTSWTAYTRTLPFSVGLANKFVDIGFWLSNEVPVGTEARKRLIVLGWQMAKLLYRIADEEDIDEWLDYADELTWSALCDHVRREEKKAGLRGPKAVRSYWMDDNQDANVKRAIGRERKRQAKQNPKKKAGDKKRLTDGDCLEIICLSHDTARRKKKKRA